VPLAATLLLAGCAADSQTEQGQTADGLRAIRLTATVGDGARADTRAATGIQSAQFDQGEEFYAYFPSGVSVGNVSTQSGTKFTTTNTSGATRPETQPYFNAGTSEVRVHAYYGKSGGSSGAQVTNSTGSFSVALDQKNDQTGNANYKASDLMYATATLTKTAASTVTGALTFTHRMAKIIVNATADTNKGVTAVTKVRLLNCYRTATISTPLSCTMNTSSGFSNKEAITLYNNSTGDASVSCAGLIPPQTISNQQFLEVTVTTAGGTGTAIYSLTKTFAGANAYTYSITVNLAAVGTTTAITNWTSAGEAVPLTPDRLGP